MPAVADTWRELLPPTTVPDHAVLVRFIARLSLHAVAWSLHDMPPPPPPPPLLSADKRTRAIEVKRAQSLTLHHSTLGPFFPKLYVKRALNVKFKASVHYTIRPHPPLPVV